MARHSSNTFLKHCSEDQLIIAALNSGLPFGKGIPVLLREPKLPTGFPDVVAVYPAAKKSRVSSSRKSLTREHFQVMVHLRHLGRSNLDEIATQLLFPRKQLELLVDDLKTAELVRTKGAFIYGRPFREIFPARRIVAIEAKLRDWRRAIEQAIANLWFASQSYILLPPLRTLVAVEKEAKKFGIGVIVFDGKQMKKVVTSKMRQIPNSYGSWLVNELALL